MKRSQGYSPSTIPATTKYTSSPLASTRVVMKGALITAGSMPSRRATSGSSEPIVVASVHTATSVIETMSATCAANSGCPLNRFTNSIAGR